MLSRFLVQLYEESSLLNQGTVHSLVVHVLTNLKAIKHHVRRARCSPCHRHLANRVVLLVLWIVWKSRNLCIFEARVLSNHQLPLMLRPHLEHRTVIILRRLCAAPLSS